MTQSKIQKIFKWVFVILLFSFFHCWGIFTDSPTAFSSQKRDGNTIFDPSLYQALSYRMIGPHRGGRCSAVTGVRSQPHTFYMGSGGVWKTVNAGQSWKNISDGFFDSNSIGAIDVADCDPNVIYVGTGQSTIRGNVSAGAGIYKSTDKGKTWSHVGLRKAGQISSIIIHPKNPDIVYAGVVGHAFGPNPERGVFRTGDGGKTWDKIFYVSDKTGIADMVMDPNNPRILYASAWTVERKPWTIISGSRECGLFKTKDGGETWKKLTNGLPDGLVGKIGIAVSPANSNRLWALVEAEDGGLFRSDDAGESWHHLETNQKRKLYQRSWYYMHIFADPHNENALYVLNVGFFKSIDGGHTFERITTWPHGDGQDMWINPDDPNVMIIGTDGGASVSLDRTQTWSTIYNQPTAELYYVFVDEQFPYRVYGPQQDNSTISIPSRIPSQLTCYENWYQVGGCECGHIAFDPKNPTIVYAGCYGGEITRYNVETGEERDILCYPQMEIGKAPKDLRYRFNWNAPIRLSPHDPNILYHCSQVVHRSTDQGQSWEVISPDLSRNEKDKQDYSGSPITYENTGIEVYSNILSFEESPHQPGLFWVGTSDGLVHISRDGGENWDNITPQGIPRTGSVNIIELSAHDPGRAFIAVLNHFFQDNHPYIYRTDNYGQDWELLTNGQNGIPADTPTRLVREDPDRKGLLYAGTESGMYVSFDNGRHWQSLQLNLPVIPVTDLRIHEKDLVLSTQGRSFWILDDVTPLHQISSKIAEQPYLFNPRDTYRMRMARGRNSNAPCGENPPNGVLVFYSFPESPEGEVSLQVFAPDGQLIQTYSSEHEPFPHPELINFNVSDGDIMVSKKAGMSRFVWDMRYPVVNTVEGAIVWGFTGGPRAAPGTYKVKISAGNWSQTQSFNILKDPRIDTTQEEFDKQLDLLLKMRDSLNQIYDGVRVVRAVRQQAKELVERLDQAGHEVGDLQIQKAAHSLSERLSEIEGELMQPKNSARQDTENFPTKLDNQLAYIYWMLASTDNPPTDGQIERFKDLEKQKEMLLEKLQHILDTNLQAFNTMIQKAGEPPIILPAPTKKTAQKKRAQ
ncbi:MAG: VPS10 domain-containing protein [Candidatus Aminicenantes bacterium]